MSSSPEAPDRSMPGSGPSPASPPGSDPTTSRSSSSPTRSAAPSSTSSPSSSGRSRYEDRQFVTGTTGSGKSTLARALFLAAHAPRIVIDPNDSDQTVVPGAVTFRDPAKATNRRGENWREAATARFVPFDPEDRDAYDAMYRWIFYNGPRWIWCDEAGFAIPAQGAAPHVRMTLTQGRKRQIGHLACHTRPREISTNLISQSARVFVFETPVRRDRQYLAENMGMDFDVFEAAHRQLPEYGFLAWDKRAKRLAVCDPLPAR